MNNSEMSKEKKIFGWEISMGDYTGSPQEVPIPKAQRLFALRSGQVIVGTLAMIALTASLLYFVR
jgi:hypothetical protein